jgi:two-component system sensor histidine kinase BaeS
MVTAAGPLMKKLLSTLGARVTALTLAVVLATAAVGSIAAVLLVQRANDAAATRSLSAMADVAQSLATLAASPEMGLARARRALAGVQVQVAVVRSETARGTVVAGDPLPRRLLTDAMLAQLLAGQDVSLRVPDDDGPVFLEGRATEAGAIVLAQRRNDAVALGQDALTRLRWAFAAVALLSVLVGWAMSRRVTTPLRRMADAAADLAAGSRDVAVPETGPAEVAAVGTALNELARSLAHSEARQREFLLSVSHDLRTPLTAVTGYAESLADGVIPADGVADIGRIVGAEAARLDRLVSDLLDLARLDAHEVSLTLVPVDLAGLLASAEPVWRRRCEAVGVVFGLEPPSAPLVVTADPDRLRQAVDGLVDNALRATPAGQPLIVGARPERGYAVLEVRDGGPGLAPEDFPVAFERSVLHERYRGVREVGTGLGLAIVARIVARHGGTVAARPAPEGGACFAITLPLSQASAASTAPLHA